MTTGERHDVAFTVSDWADNVRDNHEIPAAVRSPGRLNDLAVSGCNFSNSGSGITHTEYLHLRTVWYRYNSDTHIEDFGKLLKNDDETGYKGFVSPKNDRLSRKLTPEKLSPSLEKYLALCKDRVTLNPPLECGYFAMVRYWQVMATTHTKGGTGALKIAKRGVLEEARGRPTTPAGQQAAGDPSTPPHQIKSSSGSPPNIDTPAATSHPLARGGASNPPSADEAYVNVALLLLLQAVTMEFRYGLPELHWAAARLALHLAVPVFKSAEHIFRKESLLEARVDGYLCDGNGDAGLKRPMAICEAKAATRSSIQVSTERQEAAEMAAWICDRPLNEGLLQKSASGKKRRLLLSQNLNEIYIIIGEYGPAYEKYIRNAPWRVGDRMPQAPPRDHTRAPPAQHFEETLGSPTFLKRIAKGGIKDIEGWDSTAVEAAMNRVSSNLPSHNGPPSPPGGGSGNATNQGISGQLPLRPKTDQAPGSGTRRVTRSTTAPIDLPTADGFLVMHRFGPWRTDDGKNMRVFIRRLLALMLELDDNKPASSHSSRSSSTTGHRAPSATGNPDASTPGGRPPSVTRGRPPSVTGGHPPSVTGGRSQSASGGRPPSATGSHPPSVTGSHPPSVTGGRPPSVTGSHPQSVTSSRASSTSGNRGGSA
ncbi:hypothetical protein B0I37DRAFT_358313 [Chaetomium sp. MPI-CAGE-AT-0009]|nr:hypothetical protein B0I37DRAFT_358313 [Chaetomium sp. MPI-CAGE-AT-0009]